MPELADIDFFFVSFPFCIRDGESDVKTVVKLFRVWGYATTKKITEQMTTKI